MEVLGLGVTEEMVLLRIQHGVPQHLLENLFLALIIMLAVALVLL
jgi:hypothetical protein